jgi:hypothetical protein
MNRVCITKDGKLIEMQSGGDDRPDLMGARLETLKQNALDAGYKEDEIEVKWVTDEELQPLMAALNQPTPEQIAAKEKEALIQAKMWEMAEAELIAEGKIVAEVK